MERAGRGAVVAIMEHWPGFESNAHRATVLCGPGNNGGDGFVVARLLKARGWHVGVFTLGDPANMPPDARANAERWGALGGAVAPLETAPRFADESDLFVDALFGTGLTRPLEGAALEWAAERISDPDTRGRTVALDIPSGLCADSGRALGAKTETVVAGLTVTFHGAKPGHYLGSGPDKCGTLAVVDIGLGAVAAVGGLELVGRPGFLMKTVGHKYDHGHALVLTGGAGRTGAARLAARGAQRVGAGLVTLGAPPDALAEVVGNITAAMLVAAGTGAALGRVLRDARINALCLGPGLGRDGRGAELVSEALAARRATVLDADALSLLADHDGLFAALREGCVLTPHGGEFARLFPDLAARLRGDPAVGPAFSKVDAVRGAAARAGCVVLLKGPDTVIAAPDGRAAVHGAVYERAAPWLATAGSGDVLAGFVAGFLARGQTPFEAACGAAWLHTEAALAFGPGLIAEDLPEAVPRVLRAL